MRKFSKTLGVLGLVLALFLCSPLAVLAAIPTTGPIDIGPQGDFANLGKITPASLVSGLIKLILVIAAILFFFMLVFGGVQWIISGGDKAGSENARKRITSALVGLAIVFVAWAIANLIRSLFQVDIFQLNIPILQPITPAP